MRQLSLYGLIIAGGLYIFEVSYYLNVVISGWSGVTDIYIVYVCIRNKLAII